MIILDWKLRQILKSFLGAIVLISSDVNILVIATFDFEKHSISNQEFRNSSHLLLRRIIDA